MQVNAAFASRTSWSALDVRRKLATLRRMKITRWVVGSALALGAYGGAWAGDGGGPAFVTVAGGPSARGSYSLSAGIAWPWAWRGTAKDGAWTGATELFISRLNAHAEGLRQSRTMIGALPVFRYRAGGSDWFAEGGVGATWMDALYRAGDSQFSTQFNFISVLGIGRSFGVHRNQELSLRVSHISNAGIENPNPGENFLQLRYSRAL